MNAADATKITHDQDLSAVTLLALHIRSLDWEIQKLYNLDELLILT